jgi:hypothetical protein
VEALILHRYKILLASARGEPVNTIPRLVGRNVEEVRQIIHNFDQEG